MHTPIFPAHIRIDGTYKTIQSVEEHCKNVAEYAKANASDISMENLAFLAGFFHDMGKFTTEFNEYITKAANHENVVRGSVNHTFAGVRYLFTKFLSKQSDPFEKITIELLAYAIGAHHGLFDVVDGNAHHGLEHRLIKAGTSYDQAMENGERILFDGKQDYIEKIFKNAISEVRTVISDIDKLAKLTNKDSKLNFMSECCFYVSLLERMLISSLIDADRQDTAEFMENKSRKRASQNFSWGDNVTYFEAKFKQCFPASDISINISRTNISELCKEAAKGSSGIYRLNIPTGAGKTLDSLRYALHHAQQYNKKRIIYIMPLLSIIEQNASVIKSFVKDSEIVLEHHSSVVNENDSLQQERYKLLTENWESPIIITTLVQFLNILFSHKTGAIRRMHSLANSIIIFDEVQTVPIKMLSLFNLACNFLSKICESTIILCSATQPLFENTAHPMYPNIPALIDINKELLAPFDRVKLVNQGLMDKEEIVRFAYQIIAGVDSLLIVCNTKTEAQQFFQLLKEAKQDNVHLFHISAGMCRAHRTDIIIGLRNALVRARQRDTKVICVSTQVIEAGVDISFMSVIRLQAGMDSIIQSAGRCNRHGEMNGTAIMYIVDYKGEHLNHLREIQEAKNATYAVLQKENDFESLQADEAISYYYKNLYRNMKGRYQDFVIPKEKSSIFELLSLNLDYSQGCIEADKYFLKQAFKTAGESFKVFDRDTFDVIVPYKDGASLIAEICSEKAMYDISYTRQQIRAAAGYTVAIYSYQLETLKDYEGIVYLEDWGLYIVNPDFYDDDLGIVTEAVVQKGLFF